MALLRFGRSKYLARFRSWPAGFAEMSRQTISKTNLVVAS
jgi:hypothetical protein